MVGRKHTVSPGRVPALTSLQVATVPGSGKLLVPL